MLRRQFLSSPITGSPASMAVPRVRGIIPNWRILVLEPNGCRDRLTRTLTRIPTRTLTLPQNRTLNPDSGFGCGIASARSRSAEKRAKCTANVPIRAPFLRIRCCLSASYWNNINPPPVFAVLGRFYRPQAPGSAHAIALDSLLFALDRHFNIAALPDCTSPMNCLRSMDVSNECEFERGLRWDRMECQMRR
jgi:hypothetical protein